MAGNSPDPVYSADGSQIIGVKQGSVIAYYNGTLPGTPYSNLYVSKNGYNLYYDDEGGVSAAPGVNPLTGKPYEKVAHVYSVEQAFTFAKALAFSHQAQQVAELGRKRGVGQNREQLIQQFQGYADENEKLMDEILKADPGDGQKMHQLGHAVAGYNELGGDELAENYTRDWMAEAMLAKGYSDPVAHDAYLKSMGYKLVEASPTDRKWGAGISLYRDEDLQHYSGANLQGELLTRVRDRIVSDEVYREHVKEDFNKRIQAVDARYSDNNQRSFNKQAERQEQQNKESTIYYSVVAKKPGDDGTYTHVFTSASEAIEALRGYQLVDYKRFKTKEYADSWVSLPTEKQRAQYYDLLKEAYKNGTPVPKVQRPSYPDQQPIQDDTKIFNAENIEDDNPSNVPESQASASQSQQTQSTAPTTDSRQAQESQPMAPENQAADAQPSQPTPQMPNAGGKVAMPVPPKAVQPTQPAKQEQQSAAPDQQDVQAQASESKKKPYVMALTGHRPPDVTAYMGKSYTKYDKRAYNYNNKFWQATQKDFEAIIDRRLKEHPEGLELHSGLAQGADTVWAHAVLKKREEYPGKIKFVANVPDFTQANNWSDEGKQKWQNLLNQADVREVAAPKGQEYDHKNSYYEKRNQQMIFGSDETLCFYDGRTEHPYVDKNGNQRMKRSGTWNGYKDAVKNAKEYGGKVNTSVNPAKIAESLGYGIKFENLPKHDAGLYATYGPNYDGEGPNKSGQQDQSQNGQQNNNQQQGQGRQTNNGQNQQQGSQQNNDQQSNHQQVAPQSQSQNQPQNNGKNGPQYPEGRDADNDETSTQYTMTAFGTDPRQTWTLLKKADAKIGQGRKYQSTYQFSNAYAGRNTRSKFNLAEQMKYEALLKKRIAENGKINVQCSFDPGTNMAFTRAAMALKQDKAYRSKITVIGNFAGPQEFVGRNDMVKNPDIDYHTGHDFDQSAAEEAKLMMNDMDKVNHYQYKPTKDGHYEVHVEQWDLNQTRTYISGSPSGFDQDFNNAEQEYAEAKQKYQGNYRKSVVPEEVTDKIHHNMIDKSHEMLALYSGATPYNLTWDGKNTKYLSDTAKLVNYAQHNPEDYDSSTVPAIDDQAGVFVSDRAVDVEKTGQGGKKVVEPMPMMITDVSPLEVADQAANSYVYKEQTVDGEKVNPTLSTDSFPHKVPAKDKDGNVIYGQNGQPKVAWDYRPSHKRATYLEGFKTNYYEGKFSGRFNGYGSRSYYNQPADNNNNPQNNAPQSSQPLETQPKAPQSTQTIQPTAPAGSHPIDSQSTNSQPTYPPKPVAPKMPGGTGVATPTQNSQPTPKMPGNASLSTPSSAPVDPSIPSEDDMPPEENDNDVQPPIDFNDGSTPHYNEKNIPDTPDIPQSEDDSIPADEGMGSGSQQLQLDSVKATEHPGDHSVEDAAKQVKDTGKFKSKASQVNLQKQVEKQKKIQQAKRNKEADVQNTQQPKKSTNKSKNKSDDKEFGD